MAKPWVDPTGTLIQLMSGLVALCLQKCPASSYCSDTEAVSRIVGTACGPLVIRLPFQVLGLSNAT